MIRIMPSKQDIYRNLAAKYGKLDPNDSEAVDQFYEKDVYNLPRFSQLRITLIILTNFKDIVAPGEYEPIEKDIRPIRAEDCVLAKESWRSKWKR